MFFDFDIWRFIFSLGFAKSGTWKKDGDVYFFHVGTISEGNEVAIKIIFLPFLILVGFRRKE